MSEAWHLDFGEAVNRASLRQEIASRQAAWDWTGLIGLLPDPDPALRKLSDGGVSVLEALTADAHLTSVIQSRKLGTLRKDYRWEPGTLEDAQPTAEEVQLRDWLVEDLDRIDLYSLLSGILDAPLYGMSAIEILWAPGEGRLRIADLVVKPARWFGFNEENRPRFVSQRSPWEGELLPFGKVVFARHFPTYDNPYGLRLLSRCFWPATFKKGGVKFWVTLAEKYGMPFVIGKYGQGTPPEKQAEMLSALTRMIQDAVAVIPDNGSVEFLDASGKAASADLHAGLKTAMDAEMSKVIVGQTLTAEVGETGSYAAAKTHAELLEDYRDGDQRLAKATLEEIAWIYGQVNAPGAATPAFDWWEEESPKKEMADRDLVLSQTGIKFRKSYYVRQYGYQEDDFDVQGPGAGGQGPGTGNQGPEEQGPGFAQGDGTGPSETPDLQIDRLETEAGPGLDAMIGRVRALAEECQGLGELRDRLLDLYPELDDKAYADVLAQALSAAALAGRAELMLGV